MKYPKNSWGKLSGYFSVREFDCPCSNCTETLIDPELITKLNLLRGAIGKSLRINSGYRCQHYQDDLRLRGYETSIGPSEHSAGRAADIMSETSGLSGIELERLARSCGFSSVGVGHNWLHVDLRPGFRRWEYKAR